MTQATIRRGRGFASMSPERRSEVAGIGGRTAHQQGRAHTFSSEEAREAGRKGAAARKAKKLGTYTAGRA